MRWIAILLLCLIEAQSKVLVLGSKGLIGSALVNWLHANNYEVVEVYNRQHTDLRIAGALDSFTNVTFVHFLACEVGGSKYIDGRTTQLEIIQNNMLIYQVVFDWLQRVQVPFIFTSSYLQHQPTAYGSVKRLGEAWIDALGFGRSARLWNIYGPEKLGPRSHVMGDWINNCLTKGKAHSMTNGQEYRQFLHVEDTAAGLGIMMEHYNLLTPVTDLSTGIWTQLTDLARLIASTLPCTITFSDQAAITREKIEPNLTTSFHQYWNVTISLQEGIKKQYRHYSRVNGIHTEL